jgi:hypothetical protein
MSLTHTRDRVSNRGINVKRNQPLKQARLLRPSCVCQAVSMDVLFMIGLRSTDPQDGESHMLLFLPLNSRNSADEIINDHRTYAK